MNIRKMRLFRSPLQRRIVLLITLGAVVVAVVLGVVGYLAVRESINRTLEERLTLASVTANYVEYVLRQNLLRLEDLGPTGEGSLEDACVEPQRGVLRTIYFQSIFDDRVFLVGPDGRYLCTEPASTRSQDLDPLLRDQIQNALSSGKVVISPMITLEPGGKPVLAALVPIKGRQGEVIGLAGGTVDLTGPGLSQIIAPVKLGETGYVEVVDSKGVVLASTREGHLLSQSDHGNILADLIRRGDSAVRTCHSCHTGALEEKETEVMAFAPLPSFPWGVSVRQAEGEALAPSRALTFRFALFGVVVFLFVLFLAFGIARGVIRPIRVLQEAAGRITRGELREPIPPLGRDEVGQLGASLDTMRARLNESLETIQAWNQELEARITERTRELEDAQAARSDLLKRLISTQEEERKRIARELHDETSQNLARISMYLDRLTRAAEGSVGKGLLDETRDLLLRTTEGINRLIYDLRPSILDDLGLVPALQWYAEAHLAYQGTKVRWELDGVQRRLPGLLETGIFRVIQEAITNIAKHADASNVLIGIEFGQDTVTVEVEDDGRGFDPNTSVVGEGGAGLGIMGMRERVAILNGEFHLSSEVGKGTYIRIRIPFREEGPEDV